MMYRDISGVISAGGSGKRLNGIAKANIEFGGKTIISRIIDVIAPLFREIIIVTNTPQEFIYLSDHKIVGDRYEQAGPLGGIHAALCASQAGACFVIAGDMPLIDRDIVEKQCEHYLNTHCDILIPSINNFIEPLHSVYNISILPVLEQYLDAGNNYAVREFIRQNRVEYISFDGSEKSLNAFSNINTPEDIVRISIKLGLK